MGDDLPALLLALCREMQATELAVAEAERVRAEANRQALAALEHRTEQAERTEAAAMAEAARLRGLLADTEGELERTRDQLAAARSEAGRARTKAAAAWWSSIGEAGRSTPGRLAITAVVVGSVLALLDALGVEPSRILGWLDGSPPVP